jgi:hypothetical protein
MPFAGMPRFDVEDRGRGVGSGAGPGTVAFDGELASALEGGAVALGLRGARAVWVGLLLGAGRDRWAGTVAARAVVLAAFVLGGARNSSTPAVGVALVFVGVRCAVAVAVGVRVGAAGAVGVGVAVGVGLPVGVGVSVGVGGGAR